MLDEAAIQESIEGNSRRNTELISVLRERGVVLDTSRKIEFHFWAKSQSDAAKLKQALVQNGATVKDIIFVEEDNNDLWSVTAEMNIAPVLAASLERTKINVVLAAKFDCVYDVLGTCL